MKLVRLLLWAVFFVLLGYLFFADKKQLSDSIKRRFFDLDMPQIQEESKKLEDATPAPSPDYSDEDRDRLDSILNKINPGN